MLFSSCFVCFTIFGQTKTKVYYEDGVRVIEPVTRLIGTAEKVRLAEEARLSGEKEGHKEGDKGEVEDKLLTEALIKDRLGSLYEEYRVINAWTISFFYASCVTNTALGVLIGVQSGAKILPTSQAALILNILACLFQFVFSIYLTRVRPQLALTGYVVEVAAQWLQTATMVCIVALQSLPFTTSIQNAMTWIQVAVMVVKVFAIYMIMMTFVFNYFKRKKAEEELKALEVKHSSAKELDN